MPTVLVHMVQNALVKDHFIHAFAKKATEERIAVVCGTDYYSILVYWFFLPMSILDPMGSFVKSLLLTHINTSNINPQSINNLWFSDYGCLQYWFCKTH